MLLLLSFDTTLIWIFVTFLAIVLRGLLAGLWLGGAGWGLIHGWGLDQGGEGVYDRIRLDWTGM